MATKSKIPSAAMQKRIMKTGEVTDADVEQYIKQVGMDTLQSMSLAPEDLKVYLKNITELGNKPKKKLPSKNKIDKGDSMLVVDGNDNVSKVKPDFDSSENVSFKSATKKAGEGSLDLGTAAFNKIFPNIGKFMGFVKNKFESQSKAAAETNASILGYSKEVEHSSDLLDNIVQSGERSNLILNRILTSASSNNRQSPTPPAPPPAAPPPAAPPSPAPVAARPAAVPPAATPAAPNRNKMIGAGATAVGGAALMTAGSGLATSSAPVVATSGVATQTAQPAPTSAAITSFSLQAFREADPEGAREFEEVVKTRTREIEQQLNARIPANADRLAVNMHLDANKASAESAARREALQQFAERIQRTQPQQTAPAAATPTQTTRATPTSPAAAASTTNSMSATRVETPGATGFDNRLLHIKAKKIVFKADRFEYSPDAPATATSLPAPMGGGGGSSPSAVPSGGSSPAPTSNQPASGGATQSGAANLSGLEFAGGVDQRIKPDVAEKTKSVQSAFGKKLLVTSGFRDAGRNSRAGGAEGSKHLTGDAVDVQFSGNEQDTINLIKVASEKGIGGIGVYRPGFLHFDTGSKRVWGPDYKAGSIPQWAKPALDEHMGKPAAAASGGGGSGGGGAAPAATQVSTPPVSASGSAPAAASPSSSPVAAAMPSTPSSGAAVSRASTADEAATRTPPATSTPTQNEAAPSSPSSPSAPAIDPNNPGDLEPPDAALRYSRLFNMVA